MILLIICLIVIWIASLSYLIYFDVKTRKELETFRAEMQKQLDSPSAVQNDAFLKEIANKKVITDE